MVHYCQIGKGRWAVQFLLAGASSLCIDNPKQPPILVLLMLLPISQVSAVSILLYCGIKRLTVTVPPVFNDVQTTFLWLPKPASQHRSCNEGAGGGLSHLTKHGPTWIWISTSSSRTFLRTVCSACTAKGSQSLVVDFCLYPANLI